MFKDSLNGLEDHKKALILYHYIDELFVTNDDTFSLAKIRGRLNLYFLLVVRHFGTELLNKWMEDTRALARADKSSEMKTWQNMIIPNSVEELSLRTQFLWCGVCPAFLQPLEGMKRTACCVYSQLGHQITAAPIDSFFNISQNHKIDHRPTPNDADTEDLTDSMRNASDIHFLRSSTNVQTKMFALNPDAVGITKTMAKKLAIKSGAIAEENNSSEGKRIHTHVAEVLRQVRQHPSLYTSTITPSKEDKKNSRAFKYVVEKPVFEQRHFLRRFIVQQVLEVGKRLDSELLKNLIDQWFQHVRDSAVKWHDGNGHLFIDDEKADPDTVNIDERMLDFIRKTLPHQSAKWTFREKKHYDRLSEDSLMSAQLPLPSQFNWTSTTSIEIFKDPQTIEFYYGHWAAVHPQLTRTPKLCLHYGSNWIPHEFIVLFTAMMNGIFDTPSLDAFINMIENNASKNIDNYAGYLYHDSNERHSYVWEVSFRNINFFFRSIGF